MIILSKKLKLKVCRSHSIIQSIRILALGSEASFLIYSSEALFTFRLPALYGENGYDCDLGLVLNGEDVGRLFDSFLVHEIKSC